MTDTLTGRLTGWRRSQAAAPTDPKPVHRRRPTGLRTVIQETTPEVALERLGESDLFQLPNTAAGERRWLGLLLNTVDIGGLSSRDNRDVDKGEIVQQMSGGSISVVATEELLDDDCVAFVLSPRTISTMGEFGLLINARYSWVVFKEGVLGEDAGALSTDTGIGAAVFAQVLRINEGQDLAQVIAGADRDSWERALAALDADAEAEPAGATLHVRGERFASAASPAAFPISPIVAETGELDETPGFAQTPISAGSPERADDDEFDEFDYASAEHDPDETDAFDDEADDELSGLMVPHHDAEVSGMITQALVEPDPDALVAQLGDDRLNLAVRTESLDTMLPQIKAPSISYSLAELAGAEVSSWLRDQVQLLAEASDLELTGLQSRLRQELRASYVSEMHGVVGRLKEAMSIFGDNGFARRLNELTARRDAALDAADVEAAKHATAQRARFEAEADAHAARVAAQARASFLANVDGKVRLEVDDVRRGLAEKAEAAFALDRLALMEERRDSAALVLDRAELEALDNARKLSEQHAAQVAQTVNLHTEAIRAAVRSAYAADVKRVDVLARQLAISEEVVTTKQLAEQRVTDLKADYESRLASARDAVDLAVADADKLRRESSRALEDVNTTMREQLDTRGEIIKGLRVSVSSEIDLRNRQGQEMRRDFHERLQSEQRENEALRRQLLTQRIVGWVMMAFALLVVVGVAIAVFLTTGH